MTQEIRQARAPNIYDVAARADVSIKTVSRVLNGEPNVRKALHERVMAAVEELGYRPKMSARGLAGARSFTLAAILDTRLTIDQWRQGRGNPYLERLQFAALLQCREAGYHLLVELLDLQGPNAEQQLQSMVGALNPDGVILTPPITEDPRVIMVLEKCGVPFARLSPGLVKNRGLSVSMDEREAAITAVNHLLDLGHRRIGLITGDSSYSAATLRELGFYAAMAARGASVEEACVARGDFTYESGKAGAAQLLSLDTPPTAIFASNDEMALGVIHWATRNGINVPNDVSVVGIDDFPAAQYSFPTLTTVRQPVDEMVSFAAKRLIEQSAKKVFAPDVENVTVPFRLVTRESTAPPKKTR